MRIPALLGLLVLPFAAYPLFAASLIAVDTLAGEQLFLFYAGYERRLLFDTFVGDYLASLPYMLVVSFALAGAAFAIHRAAGARVATIALLVLGVLAVYVIAMLVTGAIFSLAHLVLLTASLVYFSLMAFLIRRVAAPFTPQVRV